MSEDLTVRAATVADAPAIGAIGRVGFPAAHAPIVGAAFAAAVVERAVDGNSHYSETMGLELDSPPQAARGLLMRFTKTS